MNGTQHELSAGLFGKKKTYSTIRPKTMGDNVVEYVEEG